MSHPQDSPEEAPKPAPPAEIEERLDGRGRVVGWKGYDLTRFQIDAVAAIRAGHNVLVAAPTGAGKTLVAEYAISEAVARGKRCIYTAPVKALSNQKYRDFRDDPTVDVGLMTGDVTIHAQAQVLIMTTEILRNAIFENPALLSDVEYVIFDEIHYMDDRERGTVWEESLIFLPQSVRLVCLSATISNVEELGSWLGEVREADRAEQASARECSVHARAADGVEEHAERRELAQHTPELRGAWLLDWRMKDDAFSRT